MDKGFLNFEDKRGISFPDISRRYAQIRSQIKTQISFTDPALPVLVESLLVKLCLNQRFNPCKSSGKLSFLQNLPDVF
jgi:hypothetical protein